MPLIFPILIGFGTLAALLFSGKREPGGSGTGESGDPLRTGELTSALTWRDEDVRVAYCALWSNQIWDPMQMAIGTANAVYPDHQWPPPTDAPVDQIETWRKIRGLTADVVKNPEKYCA